MRCCRMFRLRGRVYRILGANGTTGAPLTNGANPHPRLSIWEGHAYGASLQEGRQHAGSNPAASTEYSECISENSL